MNQERKPKLLNRLNRIGGQVKGVAKMVEDERYCIDILTQIQAIRAALGKVETELLRDHIAHCVHEAFTTVRRSVRRRRNSSRSCTDQIGERSDRERRRADVAPAEPAIYCPPALTAASEVPSKAAVRTLASVTLAGLRPYRTSGASAPDFLEPA
jgi:DNA-binding FrmR family transcriptional regulator